MSRFTSLPLPPSVRRSLRKTPKGQRGKGQQGRVVEVTAGGARSGAKGRKCQLVNDLELQKRRKWGLEPPPLLQAIGQPLASVGIKNKKYRPRHMQLPERPTPS